MRNGVDLVSAKTGMHAFNQSLILLSLDIKRYTDLGSCSVYFEVHSVAVCQFRRTSMFQNEYPSMKSVKRISRQLYITSVFWLLATGRAGKFKKRDNA